VLVTSSSLLQQRFNSFGQEFSHSHFLIDYVCKTTMRYGGLQRRYVSGVGQGWGRFQRGYVTIPPTYLPSPTLGGRKLGSSCLHDSYLAAQGDATQRKRQHSSHMGQGWGTVQRRYVALPPPAVSVPPQAHHSRHSSSHSMPTAACPSIGAVRLAASALFFWGGAGVGHSPEGIRCPPGSVAGILYSYTLFPSGVFPFRLCLTTCTAE
jgi:hypothetical protein